MFITHKQFRLTAVAAALTAVFGTALADDELAEFIEPESTVSVGIGSWSGDRKQMGTYDGMRDSGAYGLIDADVVKRDNETGTWYKFQATDLGLENREVKAEILRQGDAGISLEYNNITRDDPKEVLTTLTGEHGTTQVEGGGPMRKVELGTRREQVNLGLYKNLRPGLDFNLSFKNESKDGNRLISRGDAFRFVSEPIDSTTRQLEARLSYTVGKFQLQGGYYGSWYSTKNTITSVLPTATPTATSGFLSQGLDNEAHQLFLNGGYNFSKTTRATFKLERARATQDDSLAQPGGVFVGAPKSLNAKVTTTLAQVGLNTRPIKDLTINANLRYHDVDDDTPVVATNGAGTAPHYVGYSYRTVSGKLEGTYRLDDNYSLSAGIEDKHQDRTMPVNISGGDKVIVVPFRRKLEELASRVELRRSLSDTMNGALSWQHIDRSGGGYKAAQAGNDAAGGLTDVRNITNPMNVADRKRDKLRFALDWSPTNALSLQFTAEESRDRYDNDALRSFGLDKGDGRLYGLDAAWTITEKFKLTAWYSWDQNRAQQLAYRSAGSGGNQPAVKDYDLKDTTNALGVGFRTEVNSRLNVGGDLEASRNVSRFRQDILPLAGGAPAAEAGFTTGVPDIHTRHLRLSLFSVYALNKQSDLRFDVIHERWKTDDWTWQFANGTALIDAGGSTYLTDPKETANFVGVRYIYKFQ